ncbi:hypothetical protein BHE74_00052748 [Ensete ventricosum]|nr:hypothetical protein BHE74_00052748 [Ensete ventricosum]
MSLDSPEVGEVSSSSGGMCPGDVKAFRALKPLLRAPLLGRLPLRAPLLGRPSRKKAGAPRKVLGKTGRGLEVRGARSRLRWPRLSLLRGEPPYPRAMKDLCQTQPRREVKSFQALHIIDLQEGESSAPLQARWLSLTNESRFWLDGVAAAEFDQGVLNLALEK